MFYGVRTYAGENEGHVANKVLENMVEGTVQNENTSQVDILGLCCNPTGKKQEGSQWTGAHEEFQYGESDVGAWTI